ncbi:MAG: hypothetical protein JXJ04_13660, partial [Spirochaetales bacterium]|nr:hypothetical protein [Spirochaetales bacterium]
MKNISTGMVENHKTIILVFSFFLLGHLFLHAQSPEIDTTDDHFTQTTIETQKNSEHTVLKDEEGLTADAKRPAGWAAETHHKSAGCNYSQLFDDSKVQRIDIIIDPQVYKIMEEDVAK